MHVNIRPRQPQIGRILGVLILRSVDVARANIALDEFQHMINILLKDDTTEEKFDIRWTVEKNEMA